MAAIRLCLLLGMLLALGACNSPGASPTAVALPDITPTASASQHFRRVAAWGAGAPEAMALSADGATLYLATAQSVQRHDARNLAQILWRKELNETPTSLALSPDGKTLALSSNSSLTMLATDGGVLRKLFPYSAPIADVAYAPDGTLIALALESGTLALIQPENGSATREMRLETGDLLAPPGPLTGVAFAPDGRTLVTGDQNGNVVVWSAAEGRMLAHGNAGMRVVADVAYSPDGALVAAASEGWTAEPGSVWLFDAATGAMLERLTIDEETRWLAPVKRVLFVADGSAVVAGTSDGAVVRWSWPEGAVVNEIAAHRATVTALALAPEGDLFTAGHDGALRHWDAAGALRATLDGMPPVTAVAIDQGIIASGGVDGTLTFWTESGERRGQVEAHAGKINALALRPDGQLLASAGDDGMIRLWTWPAGAPAGRWPAHEGPALSVTFAPDGSTLASSGADGTARLWALPDGAPMATLTVIEADGLNATTVPDVAFTDQGRSLVAASGAGTLWRFMVPEGTPLPALETGANTWLMDLVSLPDHRLLAVDNTGALWLWHADGRLAGRQGAMTGRSGAPVVLDERRLIASWMGLSLWRLEDDGLALIEAVGSVGGCVAAAADGRSVVVGSPRGSIEVWRVE
ncbi:MAG: hypothetical protein RMK84_15625 [Oscillochloridaceae bacterium]|nr:WD40 repeat domain-containing protein [Chloroflexaceae bacterium]MDW8391554.1 hypothetical protein [Oscillochloridaceae bacterium]